MAHLLLLQLVLGKLLLLLLLLHFHTKVTQQVQLPFRPAIIIRVNISYLPRFWCWRDNRVHYWWIFYSCIIYLLVCTSKRLSFELRFSSANYFQRQWSNIFKCKKKWKKSSSSVAYREKEAKLSPGSDEKEAKSLQVTGEKGVTSSSEGVEKKTVSPQLTNDNEPT